MSESSVYSVPMHSVITYHTTIHPDLMINLFVMFTLLVRMLLDLRIEVGEEVDIREGECWKERVILNLRFHRKVKTDAGDDELTSNVLQALGKLATGTHQLCILSIVDACNFLFIDHIMHSSF
jgi:hypothetical protein